MPPIKKQLIDIYEGTSGVGSSVQEMFKSVDPDYAFDSLQKGMPSIGALVVDMLSRREAAVQRLKRNESYRPSQKENFSWKTLAATKKEAWRALKNQFKRSQTTLLALIDQQDEVLFKPNGNGKTYSFQNMLSELLRHETRLLGQIEYIHNFFSNRKEPEKGILKYSFRVFPFENLARQK